MNEGVKEIFKSSVVTVNYDEQYNLVYLNWHCSSGPTLKKFKEPFQYLLYGTRYAVHGIIADVRNKPAIGAEMRNWLQTEVTPVATERGLKCYFAVSDTHVLKQYYMNTIFKMRAVDSIERKLFSDYNKAEQAIKEVIAAHYRLAMAS